MEAYSSSVVPMTCTKRTLQPIPDVFSGITTLPGHAEGTMWPEEPLLPLPFANWAVHCLTACSHGSVFCVISYFCHIPGLAQHRPPFPSFCINKVSPFCSKTSDGCVHA